MSNKNDIALSVKHVAKDFILPHEQANSIKTGILGMFRRKNRSKEVQRALKDISFDVKKGEFFGVLGKNGSGKSTLLKVLAEIYQPSRGSVHTEGKLVPFLELGVGFNPELTGRENVYLNGALLGFSRKEIDARYDEIVEFAELEDFMDQKLKNYSSGMQVRLAFSVATRAEADILLVDEVLAVGDADFQRKCYNFFKSLKKSSKTVIFVTHDMGAVREYCDRAILIKDGEIAFEGESGKIADEYLKLFNKVEDADSEQDEGGGRWGTGAVRVSDSRVEIVEDTISVSVKLDVPSKSVDDVVVGIRLLDAEGNIVAGANSINAQGGVRSIGMSAGEAHSLTFSFENILGTGTYTVGVTVRSADGVTVYDNIDSATRFSVSKDETYYPIVLPARLDR
jgi:ABC-2 type transport system ATP-binding protein